MNRCRQEMLMSWIRLGNARWDILVKVLQDVHEVAVAEQIKKMLSADTTNRCVIACSVIVTL